MKCQKMFQTSVIYLRRVGKRVERFDNNESKQTINRYAEGREMTHVFAGRELAFYSRCEQVETGAKVREGCTLIADVNEHCAIVGGPIDIKKIVACVDSK